MNDDNTLCVLGLDPGIASFGWAVAAIDGDGVITPSELGVIRTDKAKGKVLCRDDDHARCAEIARALLALCALHSPRVICAEALSHVAPPPKGMRSRMPVSTMTKQGRVWGLVDMLCEVRRIPLLQASPQTIKRTCTGRVGASKADVLRALDERYAGRVTALLDPIRAKTRHEHPVDALGAIVALEHHDLLRALRRRWS